MSMCQSCGNKGMKTTVRACAGTGCTKDKIQVCMGCQAGEVNMRRPIHCITCRNKAKAAKKSKNAGISA